jgi:hypothetical protein
MFCLLRKGEPDGSPPKESTEYILGQQILPTLQLFLENQIGSLEPGKDAHCRLEPGSLHRSN